MEAAFPPDQSGTALPLGYQGMRGAILVELKKSQPLTTKELASRLSVSLNAVRHHLKDLEQQEMVEYRRENRGVGAPTFAYRLARAAEALFPRRYETMLAGLLDGLVDRDGRASAVAMLEARYATLANRLQEQLAQASPAQRLTVVAQLLSEDGYMAEATADSGSGTLTEHNCAIQAVAERFPEICAAEAKFLSTVLGAEVNRERHILNGCTACEYRVRFDNSVAAQLEENA